MSIIEQIQRLEKLLSYPYSETTKKEFREEQRQLLAELEREKHLRKQ